MAEESDSRKLALEVLDKAAQVDGLLDSLIEANTRLPFSTLYQYVEGTYRGSTEDIEKFISTDPKAKEDLEHLLKNIAYASMPQLAAAASETIKRREHAGYLLKMTPSEAAPDQMYLSIETGVDMTTQPLRIFLKSLTGEWHHHDIPPMVNGRAQIVLERVSPIVQAFGLPSTVIYIR